MSFAKPHVSKAVDKSRQTRERTAEKVREIKQRQQNWLREREQQVKEKPPPQVHPSPAAGSTSKAALPPAAPPSSQHAPPSGIDNPGASNPFNSWLNARRKNTTKDEDNASDISGRTFTYDNHGAKQKNWQGHEVMPTLQDHHRTFEELHREAMAPRDNVALADEVINRVKRDVIGSPGFSSSAGGHSSGFIDRVGSRERATADRERATADRERATADRDKGRSASTLSSHYCCVCKALMLESSQAPMLMIPCGHNVCRSCAEVLPNCGACDSPVNSRTVNIMLQQIIQDYHSGRHVEETSDKENRSRQAYSPKKYSGSSGGGSGREQQQQQQRAKYQAELQTLATRLEVLGEEHHSLQNQAAKLSGTISVDQQTVERLAHQEARVNQEIRELQERQDGLRRDRASAQRQLEERKTEQKEVQEKLDLISSTICSLSQQVEKVKLLAEGSH